MFKRSTLYTYRLKAKEWKKTYYANNKHKKVEVPILILDKINFKTKNITRDKEDVLQ